MEPTTELQILCSLMLIILGIAVDVLLIAHVGSLLANWDSGISRSLLSLSAYALLFNILVHGALPVLFLRVS